VAKAKRTHGRLSIFKGKEAKLNYAVFQVLALKGPLTIYDIRREVKKRRLLHRKLYSVVNRRVRTLRQQGYIEEVGTRKTLTGDRAVLYQLTPKAYLAMLLNQININWLIEKASETDTLDLSAILAKYLKD
jgi:chromosome segregation and condensation protein ScpB